MQTGSIYIIHWNYSNNRGFGMDVRPWKKVKGRKISQQKMYKT